MHSRLAKRTSDEESRGELATFTTLPFDNETDHDDVESDTLVSADAHCAPLCFEWMGRERKEAAIKYKRDQLVFLLLVVALGEH